MSNAFADQYTRIRQLRRDYMMAAIQQGGEVIKSLGEAEPQLATSLLSAIPNRGRAAFWLVSDMDPITKMTPLQQLARGDKSSVQGRIQSYKLGLARVLNL